MNNTYKITVKSPLLRGGLEIETECSEKYLRDVLHKIMDEVRQFNKAENASLEPKSNKSSGSLLA
jgi:hypothetical protein